MQNCSGSPILVRSILVPRVNSVTSSTSDQTSCKTASVNTTAVCEKQYRKPQSLRLDIVRKSIRDRSFSEKVAEHASKARRISTRKVYDLKWNCFPSWCCIREIDPVMASPGNVADFFVTYVSGEEMFFSFSFSIYCLALPFEHYRQVYIVHSGLQDESNKVAKIRNRYNQVPHLTQDTNGKVTNSQKTPQTRAKRSALSQQVTTKHI